MKTIVVGGGKVGFYLAKTLIEKDYDISVIEQDKEACTFFADNLDVPVIWGDGSLPRVLEKAGVRECTNVVALTGKDEVNLVACQLAKRLYNITKTVAKVNNPKNVESLKRLGVDIVISSTDMIIDVLEREVDNSRIKELIPLNKGKAVMLEVILPDDYALAHRELSEIRLPDSCNVVSVTRGEELIIPRGKTKLMSGDTLLMVVSANSVNEVKKALKLKK